VRKRHLEKHLIPLHLHILKPLDNGLILPIQIRQPHILRIVHARILHAEREPEILVYRVNCLRFYCERLEALERDGADVGAGAFDDKVLDSRESEVACCGGDEGLGGGPLLLHQSEEAFLFGFVADDGCDGADQAIVAVFGEDLVDVLQSAEDDVGEGAG
jgi:hypothetical protein